MIGTLDRRIGKALFVPLIVRFCQKSGWNQFHVHNYLYMVGSWMLLMASIRKDPSGVGLALVMAVVFTVKVGNDPGYTGQASAFLRRTFLILMPIHILAHVTGDSLLFAGPNWDESCPVGLMWLFAEYARTIETIPPLESEKPASQQIIEARAK